MDSLNIPEAHAPRENDFSGWLYTSFTGTNLQDGPHAEAINTITQEALPRFHEALGQLEACDRGKWIEAASVLKTTFTKIPSRVQPQRDAAEVAVWKVALDTRIELREEFLSEGSAGMKTAEKVWSNIIQSAVASYDAKYNFKPTIGKPTNEEMDGEFTEQYNRLNALTARAMAIDTEKQDIQTGHDGAEHVLADGMHLGKSVIPAGARELTSLKVHEITK